MVLVRLVSPQFHSHCLGDNLCISVEIIFLISGYLFSSRTSLLVSNV